MARIRIAKLVIHLFVMTCLIMWMFQSQSVYRSSHRRKSEATLSPQDNSVVPVDIQLLIPPDENRMLVRFEGVMHKPRSTLPVRKLHHHDEPSLSPLHQSQRDRRNLVFWTEMHNSDPGRRPTKEVGSPPGGGN